MDNGNYRKHVCLQQLDDTLRKPEVKIGRETDDTFHKDRSIVGQKKRLNLYYSVLYCFE